MAGRLAGVSQPGGYFYEGAVGIVADASVLEVACHGDGRYFGDV